MVTTHAEFLAYTPKFRETAETISLHMNISRRDEDPEFADNNAKFAKHTAIWLTDRFYLHNSIDVQIQPHLIPRYFQVGKWTRQLPPCLCEQKR